MNLPAQTKSTPQVQMCFFIFQLQILKKALVLCKEELLKASSTYRLWKLWMDF